METVIRWIRTVLICLITVISGTLSILFGWWRPAYYAISRFFWSPGLLSVSNIRVRKDFQWKVKDLPPCIFYANHRSHFDIPVMMYSIPRPLYFLAKKELKSVPFLGWGMAAIGMVFIDRKDRASALKSMEKAGNQIKKGKSIVTFPEGTRSSTKEMMVFKKGAFHLAKSQGIPLVPVAISGTERILPKHGKLKSGKVIFTVGSPILPKELEEMSIEEIREEAKSRLLGLLNPIERKAEASNP
ncbi:lysophospholipid acyltransferase family protein [Cryomorphaceae bacterium 1068]|nr:lysophospholipid acyltransferase family protein [Cryomorphaceae bacterium 1068]